MGWIIALALITGIIFLPIGIRAVYDHKGPLVCLLIGPISFTLYPKVKADKKATQKVSVSDSKRTVSGKKSGGSVKEFSPLVKTILDLLIDFKSRLRVNHLELKLVLAGNDPCDLALNYGKAWAALGNLMPRLESVFTIKKRNLEVLCDFTADTTVVFARDFHPYCRLPGTQSSFCIIPGSPKM